MDVFKIMNWLDKHKRKIILCAWTILIVESIMIIKEVATGSFEMYGLSFWIFVLGLINWAWLQIFFQADK
ncbi:hypothetical protein [Rossellomorea vietnamensis]|uniref:hypothetical protein n=1 Tax=Rossellomorea vietnamensis TaxID=218284 RepID=UPI000555EBE0|nr:hypothetical protein [Rossellomorea vietnamensis]